MGMVTLSADESAKSVTARVLVLSRQTATLREGQGVCWRVGGLGRKKMRGCYTPRAPISSPDEMSRFTVVALRQTAGGFNKDSAAPSCHAYGAAN
jgi:hypothetical protein